MALLMAALLMTGCCPCRNLVNETQHNVQDSVRVEVKTETVYITDTLLVEIPAQVAERTTADSTSHLENDYATSDARINPDGTLFHDLKTKPQKKPVEFQKPVERKDSIIYETKYETLIEKGQVQVERDYTWWDKTRFYLAYALLIWLLINYRKQLFSLARRIFRL